MLIDATEDRLAVREDPGVVRLLLISAVFAGLAFALSSWLVAPHALGLRVLAYRCFATIAGCAAAGLALRAIILNPIRVTTLSRTCRTVVVTEEGILRSRRKELSMKSIEMILVRRELDADGKERHRLSLGTRAGERILLSGWKNDELHLNTIARRLEKYCRDAMRPEEASQSSQMEAAIDIQNLARGVVEQPGSDRPNGQRDIARKADPTLR